MNTDIHEDDYNDLESDHADALREIERLSIANFGYANDVLMALQDKAYQLGLRRGKQEARNAALE